MPRSPRRRSVSKGLREMIFKPLGIPVSSLESVEISLDSLEALRLVDLEGLYQEAAAERMDISRATLARILVAARQTVSEALVEGKTLIIRGGDVEWKSPEHWPCPVHEEPRRRGRGQHFRGRNLQGGRGRGRRSKENDDEK